MNVTITLTNPGTDTGPFNIYTNMDNYVVPIATSVPRSTLVGAGYVAIVDGNTSTIKVESTGNCTSSIFLSVIRPTTTSTTSTTSSTTTAPPVPGSTTTTTTTGILGSTTTTTTTGQVVNSTTTTTTTNTTYLFYFEVRNQTDTGYGNGKLNLSLPNNTFVTPPITTDYSYTQVNDYFYNPAAGGAPDYFQSTFVSDPGYVIDKIVRYNYNGSVAATLLLNTANYAFVSGPMNMTSAGVAPGFYQTIKIFTKPA